MQQPSTPLILKDFTVPTVVRVISPEVESFRSKKPCAYFEWLYGFKVDGKWSEYSIGYQSEEGLTLQTDTGRIQLGRSDFRLFLSPTTSESYTNEKEILEKADFLTEFTTQGDTKIGEANPVYVEEYILESGKTYFAILHIDSFMLPPDEDGGRPTRKEKKLLWISDTPFVEGKPQKEMTPAFSQWRY